MYINQAVIKYYVHSFRLRRVENIEIGIRESSKSTLTHFHTTKSLSDTIYIDAFSIGLGNHFEVFTHIIHR